MTRLVVVAPLVLLACEGTLLGGWTGAEATAPERPGAPVPTSPTMPVVVPPGHPEPMMPRGRCDGVTPRATTRRAVRLLEKGDLAAVLRAAGVTNPTLGDLFASRPERVALAGPYETWQADDASALLERTEAFASSLVTRLVADVPACAPVATQPAVPAPCLDAAVDRLSRALFRRPPTAEVSARYRAAIVDEARLRASAVEGLRFGFELALQSPAFLYRSELGMPSTPGEVALDAFELADALALGLTGEPPDATLRELAESGALRTPEVLRAQGRRLVDTPAGRERVWTFYERWLHLKKPASLVKDATAHPQFSTATAMAAHDETRAFVLASLFGPDAPGLRHLLAGRAGDRTGVLTQRAFLASQAGPVDTRPLHVADVVLKSVVCFAVPPPPAGAVMTPFTPDPARSPRQNFEARTGSGSCAGCHTLMNGTGFAFDGYDATGLPRTRHGGFPIDTSGRLVVPSGELQFRDASELVTRLAETSEAQACHTAWLYRSVRGVDETDAESCELEAISRTLAAPRGNPLDVLVALYASTSFTTRLEGTP
ncbi:MAG: DUF1592 domain-containing protein [Myxococcaceae bacterium]|jgi:hypothetical protein|nr:DUF1592 domain-containing protein [Myxococcaceae bacterium]